MRYFLVVCLFLLLGCKDKTSAESLVEVQNRFNQCLASSFQQEGCDSTKKQMDLIKQIAQELKYSPLEFGQKVIELQTKMSHLALSHPKNTNLDKREALQKELSIRIALIALFESPQ